VEITAESVRTGACVTSGAEKLAARAGKGGGRTGVKRRRYASGDANAELLHARLQSRRFRPRRAAAPSGTATTQFALLESSQDLLALRPFQRFVNVGFRDCRNQADEDRKAGEPTHFGGLRQPQPVPSGLAGTTSANCRVVLGIVSDRKLNPDRACPRALRPSDPCRSAGFLLQAPTAGNLACAEASRVPPAASERADTENTGFPLLSEMERRVR
jgi:hypothetical protein